MSCVGSRKNGGKKHDQSIYKSAVVSTYQMWSMEGQPVNRRQSYGHPRLFDAGCEEKCKNTHATSCQSCFGSTRAAYTIHNIRQLGLLYMQEKVLNAV